MVRDKKNATFVPLLVGLLVVGMASAAFGSDVDADHAQEAEAPEDEIILEPAPPVEEMDLSQYSEMEVDSIILHEAANRVGLTEEEFQTLDWASLDEVEALYAELRAEYDETGSLAPAPETDVSGDAETVPNQDCTLHNDLQHLNTRPTATGYESYTYIPGTTECNDINLSFVTEAQDYRAVYQYFGQWQAGNQGWQIISASGTVSPWRVLHQDKVVGNNHRSSSRAEGTTAHHRT